MVGSGGLGALVFVPLEHLEYSGFEFVAAVGTVLTVVGSLDLALTLYSLSSMALVEAAVVGADSSLKNYCSSHSQSA